MFKSKCLKNTTVVGFLALLVLATVLRAASPPKLARRRPKPAADQLLKMIPAESLFCIRVNHFDYTLSQIDQFLTGISPVPMGSSILVRTQLAKVLGSPQLNGVNMNGSFAVFGAILPGEQKQNNPIVNMFIGGLVPITNYRQLIIGNPNISQPDEKGVSKISSNRKPIILITQVRNYALVSSPNDYNKLVATAKAMSTQKAGLAGALDADEAKLAATEPVWIYGNVQQASKTFSPAVSAKIEEIKAQIKKETQGPNAPPMMNIDNIINMYVSILETLMSQTKSVSITINPKPNVLNITETISAVPGTDMANMFVADASAKQKNNLLAYLEDGAMMNIAFKTNTPFMKELNVKRFDLLEVIVGQNNMTAEDIAKWKTLAADMVESLGGPAAFSFSINPSNKSPFEIKYLIEVKDAKKFNKLTEDSIKMMNASGIMDMYKGMGLEMSFEINRGCGCYKGVLIDSAKLEIKSTEPNSPQAQIMNLMFGDGFNYRWGIVDKLFVCAVSSDADSAIRKMIDQVKAGGPKQMGNEMKEVLTLLPKADKADFVATYNYLRLFKMVGAIMPIPIPQMNIQTKSNIIIAGKTGNGKLVVDIALPKEHLMEMVGVIMKMQQTQQPTETILQQKKR